MRYGRSAKIAAVIAVPPIQEVSGTAFFKEQVTQQHRKGQPQEFNQLGYQLHECHNQGLKRPIHFEPASNAALLGLSHFLLSLLDISPHAV